jgi:uncharacterized protein YutE (UPF0331/DUF86 family)/predicted nucleotidyltransferase
MEAAERMAAAGIDPAAVIAALRRAGSRFALLHGSAATGDPAAARDVDVAAWFGGTDPAPWDAAAMLPGRVDLLVLDNAPLELAGRTALHGLLLFDRYAERPTADVLADPAALGHVKYLFVTAIEGCIDAAHHIAASEGWRPAETNADAFIVLAQHGVVDAELAATMAAAARFRNLLVHGYAEVDDERVVGHLARLADVRSYLAAVALLAG